MQVKDKAPVTHRSRHKGREKLNELWDFHLDPGMKK